MGMAPGGLPAGRPASGLSCPSMDPELADFLSDVAIVIGGVVTGILVARVTANRGRDLERERRVLDLIGTYLANIETLREQGQRQRAGLAIQNFTEAQNLAHSALTQLQIVAPDLERPGLDLWRAAAKIVMSAQLRALP